MRNFILTHKAEIMFFLSLIIASISMLFDFKRLAAVSFLWLGVSVVCFIIKLLEDCIND